MSSKVVLRFITIPKTKLCFNCLLEKGIEHFYDNKGTKDGHSVKCKECMRRDQRERYYFNPGAEKRYELSRRASGSRSRSKREYNLRHRDQLKERNRAYSAVSAALKKGILMKGQCVCKTKDDIEAHHTDYSRPLDVRWLCRYHHKLEHGFFRPELFARDMFMLL